MADSTLFAASKNGKRQGLRAGHAGLREVPVPRPLAEEHVADLEAERGVGQDPAAEGESAAARRAEPDLLIDEGHRPGDAQRAGRAAGVEADGRAGRHQGRDVQALRPHEQRFGGEPEPRWLCGSSCAEEAEEPHRHAPPDTGASSDDGRRPRSRAAPPSPSAPCAGRGKANTEPSPAIHSALRTFIAQSPSVDGSPSSLTPPYPSARSDPRRQPIPHAERNRASDSAGRSEGEGGANLGRHRTSRKSPFRLAGIDTGRPPENFPCPFDHAPNFARICWSRSGSAGFARWKSNPLSKARRRSSSPS